MRIPSYLGRRVGYDLVLMVSKTLDHNVNIEFEVAPGLFMSREPTSLLNAEPGYSALILSAHSPSFGVQSPTSFDLCNYTYKVRQRKSVLCLVPKHSGVGQRAIEPCYIGKSALHHKSIL